MYQTVTAAQDWYFVHKGVNGKPIAYQVAAWGQNEKGHVIGLVGATGAKSDETPRLVAVPPVDGAYLHREQLNEEELEAAKRR